MCVVKVPKREREGRRSLGRNMKKISERAVEDEWVVYFVLGVAQMVRD